MRSVGWTEVAVLAGGAVLAVLLINDGARWFEQLFSRVMKDWERSVVPTVSARLLASVPILLFVGVFTADTYLVSVQWPGARMLGLPPFTLAGVAVGFLSFGFLEWLTRRRRAAGAATPPAAILIVPVGFLFFQWLWQARPGVASFLVGMASSLALGIGVSALAVVWSGRLPKTTGGNAQE